MRILGISGVFDTIPTQVFSPTAGFNVNLGFRESRSSELDFDSGLHLGLYLGL